MPPNPRLFHPRFPSSSDDSSNTLTNTTYDSDFGLEIVEHTSRDDNPNLAGVNLKMLDYVSSTGCASNDAGDPLLPCTYTTPRPAFLSCVADSENELLFEYDATATVFEFDYELHTVDYGEGSSTGSGNMVEIIDEFQNGLAGEIAAEHGIYCDHSSSRERFLGKEFIDETDDVNIGGGGAYAPVCLGVSSSPTDTVDDFITKCIIDVPLDQPSKCTPIKGAITLYSRSRRRLSTTLDSIQSYIETKSSVYTSENILAVSYIGKRESVGVGIINPALLSRPDFGGRRRSLIRSVAEEEEGDADTPSFGFKRFTSAGLLVGIVGAAMIAAFRRRRRTRVQVA